MEVVEDEDEDEAEDTTYDFLFLSLLLLLPDSTLAASHEFLLVVDVEDLADWVSNGGR